MWIHHFIRNTKQNLNTELLIHQLQAKAPLLILSNRDKGEQRSDGGRTTTLENGSHIVSEYSPSFGKIKTMNSYRNEIYASHAAILFPYSYSEYHNLPYKSSTPQSATTNRTLTNQTGSLKNIFITTTFTKK